MINKRDPQYRFHTHEDDGFSYLEKVTLVDMDTVLISQEPDGRLVVTERDVRPAPQPEPPKYRLVPEGDMFRIIALRPIPGVCYIGDHGGRVAHDGVLSQRGKCWIDRGSVAHEDVSILDDVVLHQSSVLRGNVRLSGNLQMYSTTIDADGTVSLRDGSWGGCRVKVAAGSNLTVNGHGSFQETQFDLRDNQRMCIAGGQVREGSIRNQFELVNVSSIDWGWVSAYRCRDGQLRFSVGCRDAGSGEQLRALALDSNTLAGELEMLTHFVNMAEAARKFWVPESVPDKSETSSFADMASRARDASDALTLRQAQP